jgi:D-alanyl-D-alanine carboxypeptidase
LPASYVPDDLVPASAAGLSRYFTVRSIMVDDLREMATAAAAAGARLGMISAYRDYTEQHWTFWYWVRELGYDKALVSSARPGHSEHQLGLVIDFTTSHQEDPWVYRDFSKETSAGRWLAANAWRYGFIMSYPLNKLAKTCYAYEPWHYRYVGRDEAAAIHGSGLTLREWLWQHQPNPEGMSPMDTPVPTAPPGVPGGEGDGAPSASPRPAGS